MRVSDYIAEFFKSKGTDLVFAITGSGSIRLIDSMADAGIEYVCPHHEQAGIMASLVRTRTNGKPAVMLVTGGPGASNTIIGVADAYLDSIPLFIIAGQENTEYVYPQNKMRGKGVQGLDMVNMTSTITKFSACLTNPTDIKRILEQAYYEAYSGRPGPVWIEIPQNLQWANIDPTQLEGYSEPVTIAANFTQQANETIELIKHAKRPLLWVGHGVRLSKSEDLLRVVIDKLGVPALASWQGADLVPDTHELFAGRAGTYGQRFGNFALQNCDLLITLGTRLALPQRGYRDEWFARAAKKVIVEIDPLEMDKFKFNIDVPVLGNVADFLLALNQQLEQTELNLDIADWKNTIKTWKAKYPMAVAPLSAEEKIVNSYWFIERLSASLDPDAIIVTDMGTSLTCTHAAIKLKEGQRVITSTGLGEMGFGLPGAIGAALGSQNKQIILVAGEGSLMMNMQELQTLKNLDLNIKIFLLNNNGYLTIKHTHNALYKSNGNAPACGKNSGVTFPNFDKIADAFGIAYSKLDTVGNLDSWINKVLDYPTAIISEVPMPEFQELIPKSAVKTREDGSVYSLPLEDLYPWLSTEELKEQMIIPLIEEV